MGEDQNRLSGLLAGTTDVLARIRLGPGVVGNTHTTAIVGLLSVVGITWALKEVPYLALLLDTGIIAFCIFLTRGTWKFARDNQDLALLGGAELLRLRLSQMAGKGYAEIPVTPAVAAPPAPAQIGGGSQNGA